MAGKSKAEKRKNVSPQETYKCCSNINISEYIENNTLNFITGSNTHSITQENDCWVGIDEAGRGPVLGPMVYGIAYSPISNKADLKTMGFADSKTLSEEQRDSMFNELNDNPEKIGWMVHVLSPHYLSTCMLRRTKYNLNEISHDTAIGLIRSVLERGVRVKEVYLDTVGDPLKYQSKLKSVFPDLNITVAKKADSTYSIVSAASICAKVARDKALQNWKFTEKVDTRNGFGCGYTSDPKTKDFLANNIDHVFGFSKIVRFSWSTASKLLDEKAAVVKWDDDEEAEGGKSKKRKVSSFFASEGTAAKQHSHRFFTERKLDRCTSL